MKPLLWKLQILAVNYCRQLFARTYILVRHSWFFFTVKRYEGVGKKAMLSPLQGLNLSCWSCSLASEVLEEKRCTIDTIGGHRPPRNRLIYDICIALNAEYKIVCKFQFGLSPASSYFSVAGLASTTNPKFSYSVSSENFVDSVGSERWIWRSFQIFHFFCFYCFVDSRSFGSSGCSGGSRAYPVSRIRCFVHVQNRAPNAYFYFFL